MDSKKIRGVNLGGWLVLERWMTPSLFAGLAAKDEYGFVRTSGCEEKLYRHRREFITEADIAWLAKNGINGLRVPVGFWALEGTAELLPVTEQLDWLFAVAARYDMQLLLCMHAAPGSQNGNDHSGRIGPKNWFTARHQRQTSRALKQLLERYGRHAQLWGVELLNEPSVATLRERLRLTLWTRAWIIRARWTHPRIRLVYSDAFRATQWNWRTRGVLDIHHYQCFSASDRTQTIPEHLVQAATMQTTIARLQRRQSVIVGEWSLGLDHQSIGDYGRTTAEVDFAAIQQQAFSEAAGWFFWNYKTEHSDGWNFRHLVESGIFQPPK